jgi:hypothetical protein
MAIVDTDILADSTAFVVPTGGTATALKEINPYSGPGKTVVYYNGDTDFTLRRTIDFTTKEPVANSATPSGYTAVREGAFMRWPRTLANGNRHVDTISINISCSPETSLADQLALRLEAADCVCSAARQAFWDSHEH